MKYVVVFLILVFYAIFSIIFGILEGLFWVFWYSTTHLGRPCIFAFTGTKEPGRSKNSALKMVPNFFYSKDDILTDSITAQSNEESTSCVV